MTIPRTWAVARDQEGVMVLESIGKATVLSFDQESEGTKLGCLCGSEGQACIVRTPLVFDSWQQRAPLCYMPRPSR